MKKACKYDRLNEMVGRAGIEPATHCLKGSYSTY